MSFFSDDPSYGLYPTGFRRPQQQHDYHFRRNPYGYPAVYPARRRAQPLDPLGVEPELRQHCSDCAETFVRADDPSDRPGYGGLRSRHVPAQVKRPEASQPLIRRTKAYISADNINIRHSKELEGATLSVASKQDSVSNIITLSKLKTESSTLDNIDANEKNKDTAVAKDVLEARHHLVQVVGDMDRVQLAHPDAIETPCVHSSQVASTQHKDLNQSLEGLQQRARYLYKRFSSIAGDVVFTPRAMSPVGEDEEDTAGSEQHAGGFGGEGPHVAGSHPAYEYADGFCDEAAEAAEGGNDETRERDGEAQRPWNHVEEDPVDEGKAEGKGYKEENDGPHGAEETEYGQFDDDWELVICDPEDPSAPVEAEMVMIDRTLLEEKDAMIENLHAALLEKERTISALQGHHPCNDLEPKSSQCKN